MEKDMAMMKRIRLWLVGALMTIASLGLAQTPPPACEDQLAMAHKLIQVLRAERDRAQEGLSQVWSQAERTEKEKAQRSKTGDDKPEEEKKGDTK
jgi:hypothetical protein